MKELNPTNVFTIFSEICKIPHGSGNTKAISDFCVDFAKKHNLEVKQDKYNNVIIKREASIGYEKHTGIILAAHLDMVCQKDKDVDFDFSKDSLKLETDGDFLFALGTTLGADDGIGVSIALALAVDKNLKTPPLEIILTTDEETGMDGAIGLSYDDILYNQLINIDSEEEGIFTLGCAGGMNVECSIPITTENVENTITISLFGLTGGHSGTEIIKNRANSNIIIIKLLKELSVFSSFRLSSVWGGEKTNAIATSSVLTFSYNENEKAEILDTISKYFEKIKEKYKKTDSNLSYSVKENSFGTVITKETTDKISNSLFDIHDGVYKMSDDIEGLVETSSNFGILRTENDTITAVISVRSAKESEKKNLAKKLCDVFKKAGAVCKINSEYPTWEYRKESSLCEIMSNTFIEAFNTEPKKEIIHAGLECGIFVSKNPNLDCVSVGPDIFDIHTPKEKLSISSTERMYKFLEKVLNNL